VILSDASIWLEEIADAQFAASVMAEYTQLAIRTFGYFLRSKIIENWCRLGAEYSITEHDLEAKITRYEGQVDASLEKSYLPSIPFFILIYIQSLDAAQPVSASAGSYGHLCELLISRSLATAHKAATLNTKKTYLAELANSMFQRNAKDFSEEEFQVFHDKHCAKYNLKIEKELLFRELAECSLLSMGDGRYGFKYPYYQHYFIALYMRDVLDTPEVKNQIEALSKKLHKADNANIWLFLSHHSKNPLLVDLILNHAKSIFSDTPVPKFEADISFFKTISESIPKIVLVNRSPAELRDSRRRQLDEAASNEEIADEDYEKNAIVRFVAQITAIAKRPSCWNIGRRPRPIYDHSTRQVQLHHCVRRQAICHRGTVCNQRFIRIGRGPSCCGLIRHASPVRYRCSCCHGRLVSKKRRVCSICVWHRRKIIARCPFPGAIDVDADPIRPVERQC
jgi:hypothetical protein